MKKTSKYVKASLKTRVKNSFHGIISVCRKPGYLLLFLLSGFLISGFLIWSLNFELVRYIVVEAPISIFEKLRFFWDVQTGIYTAYEHTQATGIILFSFLFGLNTTLIVFVFRSGRLRKIPKKSGGLGLILAVMSGGCVACGTSVLAPVLATLGATSSAFSASLSNYLNWGGSLLIIYSIYKLGGIINNKT